MKGIGHGARVGWAGAISTRGSGVVCLSNPGTTRLFTIGKESIRKSPLNAMNL